MSSIQAKSIIDPVCPHSLSPRCPSSAAFSARPCHIATRFPTLKASASTQASLPGSTFIPNKRIYVWRITYLTFWTDACSPSFVISTRPTHMLVRTLGGGRRCAEKEEDGLSVHPYSSSSPSPLGNPFKVIIFSHQGMVPPPPPQHCLVKTCIPAIASLANLRPPFGMAYLINPSQCLLTRSVEGRHLPHAIGVGDTASMPFLEADLVAKLVVSLPCHCTLCPYLEGVRQVWPRACTSPLSLNTQAYSPRRSPSKVAV